MDEFIKIFNNLSKIAEPSFQEFKTTKYIVNILKKYNIPIDKILDTGCFGTINIGAKKTICIRADIDALPFDNHFNKFKHLCGHHAHTTALLQALKNINKNKQLLKVNIRYIFQPAEEIGEGAKFIIENGGINNVDEIYGIHVFPSYNLGKVCLKKGPLMAGSATFDLTLKGKSVHAAYPSEGNDIICALSDYINLCQKIISRFKGIDNNAVLSFTIIKAGNAKNILPEKGSLSGTIRFFDNNSKKLLISNMQNILKNLKKIYSIKGNIKFDFLTEPLINNNQLVEKIKRILNNLEIIENIHPSMGAEDFSEYMKKIPGVFIPVGIAIDKNHPPLHNNNFFVPFEAVKNIAKIWETIAFNLT